MNDKTNQARNPALKVQAAREKVMFGNDAKHPPQRADIISPDLGGSYTQVVKGGVATKQVPSQPTKKKPAATKPAAPAKKKSPKKLSPAAQRSAELVTNVVASFTDRLVAKAKANGGVLSVADLDSLNKEFAETISELEISIEKSFEEYVLDQERKAWITSRTRPFDRMMVKTFSHLLEYDARQVRRSKYVSRRMLPGFFIALSLMLGTDVRDANQGRCRAIVKLARKDKGEEFEWDDIYTNPEARTIRFEALLDIAGYFSDLDKRREWFIDLINSHLEEPAGDAEETTPPWAFEEKGFDEFFKALMSELKAAVSTRNGRDMITRERHAEFTKSVVSLIKKLS